MKPAAAIWTYFASQGMGRALRHRDYRIFSITHWMSSVGMWTQRVGVGWLTWELTHSGTWLGVVAMVEAVPMFILSLFAGVVADRVDRLWLFRNLLLINLAASGVLAALTLTGHITVYLLVAIIGVAGSANAMAMPLRMTMAPSMVPREDMAAAIGLNSISFQLSATIGPAFSGLIIWAFGVGYAFSFNAFSYLVFIVSLYCVRLPYQDRKAGARTGLMSDMWDGIRYAFSHASIGPLLLLMLAAAVLTRPYQDLLPGFADDIFNRKTDGLAILVAAAGVGGMAAGLWLAQYGRIQRMTSIVLGAVLVLCVALIAFALTREFWLAVGWVVVISIGATLASTGSQMLIQNAVAGSMRGRVMSLYGLNWRGAPAVGALAMGSVSSLVGLQAPVAGAAVICLLAWAVTLPRRHIIAKELEHIAGPGETRGQEA